MNVTSKTVLLSLFSLMILNIHGQDLLKHVPKDPTLLISIHGNNLQEKMSLEEFSQLEIAQFWVKELTSKNDPNQNLEDVGIDINSEMHFFIESNDTITYIAWVAGISDKEKFKSSYVKSYNLENLTEENGMYSLMGYNDLTRWNDEVLIYVTGKKMMSNSYYDPYYSPYEYTEEYPVYDYDEEIVIPEQEIWEDVEMPDFAIEEEIMEIPDEDIQYEKPEEIMEELDYPIMEEQEVMEIEDSYTEPGYDYNNIYEQENAEKKKFLTSYSDQVLNRELTSSILSNPQFIKNVDQKADMSFFGFDVYDLYQKYYMQGMGMGYWGLQSSLSQANAWMNSNLSTAHLYFDKEEMRIETESFMDPKMYEIVENFSKAKLNKDFFKFLPSGKPLAYYSFSFDSKIMLDQLPDIMKASYGDILSREAGMDVSDIFDLFSVMLDEEAISKVFKGDALLILNSIRPIEIEYTTYDWDENFESVERKETRLETLPEFLFMTSTEDPESINKLLKLGGASGDMEFKNGYYHVKGGQYNPMQLFMCVKGGIAFLCNSQEQINFIMNGGGKNSLSKDHMKRMNSNMTAGYLDLDMLLRSLPANEFNNGERRSLEFAANNLEDIYFVQKKPSGGKLTSESVWEIPSGNKNSLTYLFEMINELYKLDQGQY